MKVAIYIRVSTEEQNPENQLRDIKSMFDAEECSIFEDKQSAWKDDSERNSFSNLKKDIKRRVVSDLYVWDLDRLFRNRKKLIEFFQYCKNYDCNIHSYNQKWLEELSKMPEPFNEAMHDLMLQIMGWIAQDESDRKSKRVKSAIRKKNGITISYKGNVWGRKGLSKKVISNVIQMKKDNPKMSIRDIADNSFYNDKNGNKKNVSKSIVHKILQESKVENK